MTRNQSVRPTAEATSEHFKNTVHNRPEASSYEEGIEDLLDDLLPEGIADEGAALAASPVEMEIRRAVMSCANHKALDSDEICAETFKALASNEEAFRHVAHYVDRFWTELNLIENKQGVIRLASIYKGKGCKRDPGNYRGVSIISIVIKIISKICAKRLSKHFVRTGGDDQHSKAGGGCADGTISAHRAQKSAADSAPRTVSGHADGGGGTGTVCRDTAARSFHRLLHHHHHRHLQMLQRTCTNLERPPPTIPMPRPRRMGGWPTSAGSIGRPGRAAEKIQLYACLLGPKFKKMWHGLAE